MKAEILITDSLVVKKAEILIIDSLVVKKAALFGAAFLP
jgi:hypothetical protein